ncbi:PAS domain-containing protein [Shewanella oneidensis MR-1]|uniref:histidine kinase n=1 Tax=Shewanella oneidensis (strain ATCC 700550 / JCM 31522 / CIP 106686 / LMG 19005 / NCIMB 14063 / MR-1) TaxID=211586 RepID=Q8EB46_SHEON|nr:ATP-binding protein [Shewanella oneidensis]AAN56673.1 two component signal transduction system histidine kinase [Shewanella oneidensis MR-1]MDX5998942.1 ATP-binding protein [Shewanella oneidensis]MEE2027530.1 Adaptive-response sensory-kinase SasA [Shewanella oneidensis]QKG98025.1 PAS domain-containing protein [Shewanella oneidensis MR-1]
MQLRTKLVIYSTVCCAFGVLLTLATMKYLFSTSSPEVATPATLPDVQLPELDLAQLQDSVAAIESAIKNTEQFQQAFSLQERLRADQIKHELQKLEQLKQEQLQIKLYKLELLKQGLFNPAPHPANMVPALPVVEQSKLPPLSLDPQAEHTPPIFELVLVILLACSVCALGVAWFTRHLARSLDALEVGLLNFNDNDFSVSIPTNGEGQLKTLAELFNHSAAKLRQERQYIYQRELLLDKVIQSSPNVMLLLNDHQRLMYANDAARHLFQIKGKMEGLSLEELLQELPEALALALKQEKSGLFTMGEDDAETWYLSRGQFLLNNQQHNLILLKQMTRELNRQEVAVWKKVIRIISHELNNSVAPIASMVNSGRLLTKDLDNPKLKLIFDTIESRTNHLSQFIYNYARFAKLPLPQRRKVAWSQLIEQLTQHYPFSLTHELPIEDGYVDQGQMEQVLLNLLKNAHESGSNPEEVTLSIRYQKMVDGGGFSIKIEDRGSGMSEEVLEQALLPFYSTKQSGTGLGLPLCREIIEAHDGSISMHNRTEGGLSVLLWLPQ